MSNKTPKGPSMYDPQMWAKAGIDMMTGLPKNCVDWDFKIKEDIKKQIRVKDEQDAINRYVWHNIPMKLSSQEIERMLYYKHSLIFFYFEPLQEFCLMPYAFDDGLDFYGRPIYVHPVPYASGRSENEKATIKAQEAYLRDIKLKVIYDVQLQEDMFDDQGNYLEDTVKELLTKSCVIIRDYTPQFSENGIPRYQLQDSIIDVMADCVPFSRTALLNSTGIVGVKVDNDTESAAVYGFSNSVNNAALAGKKYLPLKKSMGGDFQELTGGQTARSDEFLQMMQGYNNFRLGMYGLDNNGLYDKKAYVNTLQSGVNNVGLSIQDGLSQRQNSCNVINSIWGIGLWNDISETVSGHDNNLNGNTYDEKDQSGMTQDTPVQPVTEEVG